MDNTLTTPIYNITNEIRQTIQDIDETEDGSRNVNKLNIYRFKFTNEFTSELFKFSKVHQYDERKCFKEAWTTWVDENTDIVSNEILRLSNMGYDGDALDKMFKSARYYFRKKSTEKREPTKRREYVGVNKDLLDAMDDHIEAGMNARDYKPSEGFDDFCKSHVDLLKIEVNALLSSGMKSHVDIKNKIKKTYKNRYFICSR